MRNLQEYRIWIKEDVREDDSKEEIVTIMAEGPVDAMQRILKSRPPYTGVYIC